MDFHRQLSGDQEHNTILCNVFRSDAIQILRMRGEAILISQILQPSNLAMK